MKTLGLIGAGHIGSQLARLALGHGYEVVLSNSRGPDTLGAVVAELGRGARAATAQRDGHNRELDQRQATSSELLQRHLPSSKVVKAFNHVYAAQLTTDGTPPGTPNRRAFVIAGNDADAKRSVVALIDRFGFDVVDAGPLSESWRFEPNTPAYGPRMSARQLREALATAVRPPPT